MSDPLTLTVGDTAPTITGTINAVTTGASAIVHIKRYDKTVINRAATSLHDNGDGTSTWSLDVIDGDLTVDGTYWPEVEVTFSNGKKQTFARTSAGVNATFNVRDQYA